MVSAEGRPGSPAHSPLRPAREQTLPAARRDATGDCGQPDTCGSRSRSDRDVSQPLPTHAHAGKSPFWGDARASDGTGVTTLRPVHCSQPPHARHSCASVQGDVQQIPDLFPMKHSGYGLTGEGLNGQVGARAGTVTH